jgi:hypothetical protein
MGMAQPDDETVIAQLEVSHHWTGQDSPVRGRFPLTGRLKMRFCSLAREGRSYHHATKVELLVETQKGTPGLPSEYELADIVLASHTVVHNIFTN